MASVCHISRHQEASTSSDFEQITWLRRAERQEHSLENVLENVRACTVDRLGTDLSGQATEMQTRVSELTRHR
jgi:hypothetical protein